MGASTPVKPATNQAEVLKAQAVKAVQDSEPDLRSFKSGNTGLYITTTLKGQAARELGIAVPAGGKVKFQVTVIVVDPENSDN